MTTSFIVPPAMRDQPDQRECYRQHFGSTITFPSTCNSALSLTTFNSSTVNRSTETTLGITTQSAAQLNVNATNRQPLNVITSCINQASHYQSCRLTTSQPASRKELTVKTSTGSIRLNSNSQLGITPEVKAVSTVSRLVRGKTSSTVLEGLTACFTQVERTGQVTDRLENADFFRFIAFQSWLPYPKPVGLIQSTPVDGPALSGDGRSYPLSWKNGRNVHRPCKSGRSYTTGRTFPMRALWVPACLICSPPVTHILMHGVTHGPGFSPTVVSTRLSRERDHNERRPVLRGTLPSWHGGPDAGRECDRSHQQPVPHGALPIVRGAPTPRRTPSAWAATRGRGDGATAPGRRPAGPSADTRPRSGLSNAASPQPYATIPRYCLTNSRRAESTEAFRVEPPSSRFGGEECSIWEYYKNDCLRCNSATNIT